MDFSFSAEQEDLRREARAFLEANPTPSLDQLRELGWVGILQSEDFSFLDAAVLFEELGRSLAYSAAWAVAEGDEQAELLAVAAKAQAAEAAVAACERSIQVHGGIGFTWEHPLHRFYKRALWLEGLGSRPTELRLEVADALLGVTVPV